MMGLFFTLGDYKIILFNRRGRRVDLKSRVFNSGLSGNKKFNPNFSNVVFKIFFLPI